MSHNLSGEIPRRGKVMTFWLGDEKFSRRKLSPTKHFPRRIFYLFFGCAMNLRCYYVIELSHQINYSLLCCRSVCYLAVIIRPIIFKIICHQRNEKACLLYLCCIEVKKCGNYFGNIDLVWSV